MIATGRLIDLRSPLWQPRALAVAQSPCKSRAESIGKYETCMAGTNHAKNRDAGGGSSQGGWSDSPQWVERFAPAPHPRHRPPERVSGQEKAFFSGKNSFFSVATDFFAGALSFGTPIAECSCVGRRSFGRLVVPQAWTAAFFRTRLEGLGR